MTAGEVEEEIVRWRDKLRLIEENLRSFAELPAWRRLAEASGADGQPNAPKPRSAGETLTKAEAVAETLRQLRAQRAALTRVIDRATSLYATLPASQGASAADTPQEIERLLRGPSIEIALSPTPAERRELLRELAEPVRATPAQLLEMMLDAFRGARDAVLELDAVAAEALEGAERKRRGVEARLAQAASRLLSLRETFARARRASAERALKVAGHLPPGPPVDEEQVEGLAAWLQRLRATAGRGEFAPLEVALRNWSTRADALQATASAALEADEAALVARRELRGLFGALEAKALQGGRALDPEVAALGREVRSLLANRPTPLAALRELVARYEERLV